MGKVFVYTQGGKARTDRQQGFQSPKDFHLKTRPLPVSQFQLYKKLFSATERLSNPSAVFFLILYMLRSALMGNCYNDSTVTCSSLVVSFLFKHDKKHTFCFFFI
ncbi:hypothetical protein CHARACLAT_014035 [Characodon lateralis]|uniref:Uncharacterized protein n=1 Tax=Characodon lateralis TaxID=208331 RepID=A0ABU7CNJ2_9TELE|nr:hypothetical protein [Characodon lateralis]